MRLCFVRSRTQHPTLCLVTHTHRLLACCRRVSASVTCNTTSPPRFRCAASTFALPTTDPFSRNLFGGNALHNLRANCLCDGPNRSRAYRSAPFLVQHVDFFERSGALPQKRGMHVAPLPQTLQVGGQRIPSPAAFPWQAEFTRIQAWHIAKTLSGLLLCCCCCCC